MKASLVLKQIFRQAPIAHSFLMVFMFISGLALTVKSYDEKVHLISILPFLYVMIFAGMAIGKALENLRQTYVWSVNLVYKKLHHRVLIALPLSISFIFMIFVVLAGSGNEIFVLLGLMVLYTMIFAHDMQKSSIPMVTMYTTLIILMELKNKNVPFLHENYRVFILFSFYGVMLIGSIINYRKNSDYPEENKCNPPKRKLLIHRFRLLQQNYLNKKVGLSLTRNGLTFPVYGVLMGLTIMLYYLMMSFFATKELKAGIVYGFMFMLNILSLINMKMLMGQVKKYAHVFVGKNHFGIKEKLIQSMDKTMLMNQLSFVAIVMTGFYLFDLPVNKTRLVITLTISVVFFYNSYIFLIAGKLDTKFELVLISIIIYGVSYLIMLALIDKYEIYFISWKVNLSILIFAILVRYFAYQKFIKAKFENLFI